ncbi:LVIVD repeat-containing protein [Parapedobacter sp. DT-150]|uniref:LVIVD repeat-containing protein n=1 Tax=Parapedobacter sp. DT-150 TaxID=3396162 RepID=UPI003F1C1B65
MNFATRMVYPWAKLLLMACLPAVLFMACSDQVETTYTYRAQVPVYMEVETFRAADIGLRPPKPLMTTGKIYVYGDYLFINEPMKGIHIIDNRNPANPKNLNFIDIPGNVDMAVNSDILYADSYIDLLAFDVSNPQSITLVDRVEGVFPHMFANLEQTLFVTYKDTVITYTDTQRHEGMWYTDGMAHFNSGSSEHGGASYGQGGSLARFTLARGHLYAVDESSLRLFDVKTADKPQFVSDIPLGWGIETIFPYDNKLFIGSTTGMHIYDVCNPASPQEMAVYSHITACDPVVVNDKYAFVTLRSGNICQQGADLLEVVDIQDPYHPQLLKSYPMQNPHGLGLAGDNLYVCEGNSGLKSFKVTDVMNISNHLMEHLEDKKAIDVIPAPKSLVVTGPEGVYQYDYSTPDKLKLLSHIAVN